MIGGRTSSPVILMVDDDDEDIYLTKRAFRSCYDNNITINSVSDGDSLFDYLHRKGDYQSRPETETPQVILLDINLPRENGFSLLKTLKSDKDYHHLPVCMLTTSTADD